MKSTFICRMLNDPFSDPVLYIRFVREKRCFLFDLGDITSLTVKEIMMVTHVFVSHMHIDHFIGFDYLLRCNLRRDKPLYIFGPDGIINAVEGKLKGYTWNLIKEYPLKIEVIELKKDKKVHVSFHAAHGFSRIVKAVESLNLELFSEPDCVVKASIFKHQILVLGFSLDEDYHININKSLLMERGMPVGPWLKEFKSDIRKGVQDKEFIINHRTYHLSELRDIAIITEGYKIAYITDISLDIGNVESAIALAKGADILFIEAYFIDKDRDRALKRNHLTARQSGIIARKAGVKRLELIHISPKYISKSNAVFEEAMDEFKKQKKRGHKP